MKNQFKTLDRRNTDSIKWHMARELCDCKKYYTFSVADSDYETAPCIKNALSKRIDHGAFGYAGKGSNYEKIIVDWYKNRYDISITENAIIPIPSVLNGLSVIIDLFTNKGDNIIIQTPVYHVFKPVIEHNQRYVVENPLRVNADRYEMDFKGLETLFKNGYKTFVLCHPHNPVGRVWNAIELKKLVDLAKKYQVLIISDEIHSDIIMPGHNFQSLIKFSKDYDQIIVISAPTKVFNIAGLKIAQILVENIRINKKIKKEYSRLHLSTPNLLAITALKAAYQNGGQWVDDQNKHIYDNYQLIKVHLNQYDQDFYVYHLEGTYLVWIKVNLPKIKASSFVKQLVKYGVFLSEGKKFGVNDQYIRMSIACSKDQLIHGLRQWDQCMMDIK
ncbi:MAG TPA: aminotransferase class I/II-fold pyridoxal phosphate-dependent enzyme [Candidatus Izemoplasmatales bacterium]|nr:aminotransferase class I/II-fold pyridoxal phosphate-dependent enzyme [Candidatus Izemoplasmatales bacterium]